MLQRIAAHGPRFAEVGGVRHIHAIAIAAALAACGAPDPEAALPYLTDRAARRAALERALWRPDLPYSRQLLSNYALESGGWELLPALDTAVAPLRAGESAQAALSARGARLAVEAPSGEAGWLALGRRVFFELPMRSDDYVEWLIARPDLWERAGVEAAPDGTLVGLVAFEEAGEARVGMTCALCHAGGGEAGRAARGLDVGWVRARFAEARGLDGALFDGWGAGRLDVTDDGTDGPTAVPDLWSLAEAQHLNHSGVIAVDTPMTLAIRFETQYVLGHEVRSRPSRVQMWALAAFVRSLTPPPPLREAPAEAGSHHFAERCAGCHDPSSAYGGGLVSAEALVSDPTVAFTPERGTGFYKVPSLRGVGHAAPYLHDGSAATLDDLLASGHPHGAVLRATERAALIEFLLTL